MSTPEAFDETIAALLRELQRLREMLLRLDAEVAAIRALKDKS